MLGQSCAVVRGVLTCEGKLCAAYSHLIQCILKSAAPAAAAASSRILPKGLPVPPAQLGKHKGMESILQERGLYPQTGNLKGACANEKAHTDDNKCCCQRVLASQRDFRSERSDMRRVVFIPDAIEATRRTYDRNVVKLPVFVNTGAACLSHRSLRVLF